MIMESCEPMKNVQWMSTRIYGEHHGIAWWKERGELGSIHGVQWGNYSRFRLQHAFRGLIGIMTQFFNCLQRIWILSHVFLELSSE